LDVAKEIGLMSAGESGAVSKHLRILLQSGTAIGLSDSELLSRYLSGRDEAAEAAFGAIVERHGPMVLRVCRGVLGNSHDAEDAFQAVFLVLALRATAVRDRDSLASWLYGVAWRAATKARLASARRRAREQRRAEMINMLEPRDQTGGWSDLHEEVNRLPEKYRAPVVLCYLGGLTHEETADQLRLPLGTVKVRLSRARERLRARLARRGLAPSVIAAAWYGSADGAMPVPLVNATVNAALRIAVGRTAGVSASVTSLVKGVLKAMLVTKLKTGAACVAATLILLAVTTLAVSGNLPARSEPARTDPVRQERTGKAVVVETLRRAEFARSVTQIGISEAFDSVDLRPKISGYLNVVKVEIGDKVKRGQVLAQIAAPEIEADEDKGRAIIEQAEARVAHARATVVVREAALRAAEVKAETAVAVRQRAESAVKHREKVLERLKDLVAKKVVSQQELDGAEETIEAAKLALTEATAQVTTARTAIDEAKANLLAGKSEVLEKEADRRVAHADARKLAAGVEATRIVAPLDGIVTQRGYHVGEFVRAGEGGSQPLFRIINTAKIRVIVEVPDSDAPFLDPGDRASVRFDATRNREYSGTVARTAFAEDPRTQTLRAEIDLDNTDGSLRAGQWGRVTIFLEDRGAVLSVPLSALVARQPDGPAECYRVVDGRAVRTRIRIRGSDGARYEVVEGLKEGDTVITNPSNDLKDGQLIEVETRSQS
jgi:RND family efflux transporter MFP subunit